MINLHVNHDYFQKDSAGKSRLFHQKLNIFFYLEEGYKVIHNEPNHLFIPEVHINQSITFCGSLSLRSQPDSLLRTTPQPLKKVNDES